MDQAETVEQIEAELTAPSELEAAEAEYERFVWANLPRNFAGHFMHGMLGMTGFRIFNAPTFLPAYLHLITGSALMVGLGQSLQSAGGVLSPVIGAAAVEHRKKVLPVSMWMGTLMRVQVLAIALCAWFLHGSPLVVGIMICLFLLGIFQGAQGVAFQMLLAKVIPTRRRGLLQSLRNFFGGLISAGLALFAGSYLIGRNVFGNGYATTFILAAILTSLGLTALGLLMREPEPPTVKPRTRTWDRMREFPQLLRADRGYFYFMIAQTCATAGRIGVPFYVLFAAHVMPITGPHGGADLGLMSLLLFLGDSCSNLVWGTLGDRFGFRSTFIGAMILWAASTVVLMAAPSPLFVLVAFAGLGAGPAGFNMSSQTMVLEFGSRDDVPMRLGLSQTAQGLMNTLGPLAGGVVAWLAGYPWVLGASVAFEAVALVLLIFVVDEPRYRRRNA
ncbi:MAG TPA: MFS transporter [Caulobacteraceae bacterium]